MIRALPLLLLAGCAGSAPVALPLELSSSFAEMGAARICLVSDEWALEARFEEGAFAKGVGTKARPADCTFYRGHGLRARFQPSAGPAPLPGADGANATHEPVTGLVFTLLDQNRMDVSREESRVTISLSEFHADDVTYAAIPSITLPIRGPYP